MGDMADDFLNDVMDTEDSRLDWRMGHMDNEEAYDRGIIDEYGAEGSRTKKSLICRCCGKGSMTWGRSNSKWRLFENESLHRCSVNPLKDRSVKYERRGHV